MVRLVDIRVSARLALAASVITVSKEDTFRFLACELFDAHLEGFEASDDLAVVVVLWSDGHCEEDSYVMRCVYVYLLDCGSSGIFTPGRIHILSSSAELSDSFSSSAATSMSSDGVPATDWWSSDASVAYAS